MMKGLSKGNRIAVIFIVLMFLFGIIGLFASCSKESKTITLIVGKVHYDGHVYLVFEQPTWNDIVVMHSEDCPCYVLPSDSDTNSEG